MKTKPSKERVLLPRDKDWQEKHNAMDRFYYHDCDKDCPRSYKHFEPNPKTTTPTKQRKERCKHRNIWLICSGNYSWCYVCGAIREMNTNGNRCWPASGWCKPTGNKDNNPYEKLEKTKKRYL